MICGVLLFLIARRIVALRYGLLTPSREESALAEFLTPKRSIGA
jgi:hypothetical protein